MMAVIFATMVASLVALWLGRRRIAVGVVLGCLALSVSLFLWEIWSPETGFRMPWIRTDGGTIGGEPHVG